MSTKHYQHSCNKLFRFWLMALIFCGLPISDYVAQTEYISKTAEEECVTQSDVLHCFMMQEQQKMPAGFVVTAKNGERIGSSRPVRLIPTHGGKSGRMLSRLTSASSIYHSNLYSLLFRLSDCGIRVGAASPRFYYVIALRRILC
ncbi:MAG: hypothetical protein IJJ73_10465 [Bacteroidaceae bacterium]|nr:hypothetical protein [Bacteroidaceae bacterium]